MLRVDHARRRGAPREALRGLPTIPIESDDRAEYFSCTRVIRRLSLPLTVLFARAAVAVAFIPANPPNSRRSRCPRFVDANRELSDASPRESDASRRERRVVNPI